MTEQLSKSLIEHELEKHGIKPNPAPEMKVTDAVASASTQKEKNEAADIEEKIRKLQRGATFSMKMTAAQVEKLEREAVSHNVSWKEYLTQRITNEILEGMVGQVMPVKAPTFAKGKLVTGPSKGGAY